jgi:hypothetical protein
MIMGGYPDYARRLSDEVRLHIVCGNAGKWIAARLSDGGGDGTVYDTRADAIAHQLHETQCAYLCIPHDDLSPRSAGRYLEMHRELYDGGFRLSDPDDPRATPGLGGMLRMAR